jgi:hypothetical protein
VISHLVYDDDNDGADPLWVAPTRLMNRIRSICAQTKSTVPVHGQPMSRPGSAMTTGNARTGGLLTAFTCLWDSPLDSDGTLIDPDAVDYEDNSEEDV